MGKFKEYREIEKSLQQRFKVKRENEVELLKEDFKYGKLTASGYNRLKDECEYIKLRDEINIVVPEQFIDGVKAPLEQMAAVELSKIRKDRTLGRIIALICLLIGAVLFGLGQVFSHAYLVSEITLVAAWVFVWAAVDRYFFEGSKLRVRRLSLIQIVAAKLKTDKDKKAENEEE